MSNNKGLHTAIKEVMKQFGDDILASPKLVNYLADYSAFRDYPACKVILKDLQESGEMQKVYDAYKSNRKNCKQKIDTLRSNVQGSGKYKRGLVAYVYECFLFAFGAVSSVSEPSSGAFDAYSNQDTGSAQNIDEQINDLKQEYNELLDRLAVKPKDLLHDPAGYYPAMAMNKLYLIEAKIQVLSETLGVDNKTWCKDRLSKKIAGFQLDKKVACEKELKKLKHDYSQKLKAALVLPTGSSYIAKSASFDSSLLVGLSSVEDEIIRLCGELELPYDNWCENEQKNLLSQHSVSPTKRRSQILTRIVAPSVIAIAGLWAGGSYVSSKGEIDKFNDSMAKANEQVEQGNYVSAFMTMQDAKDGYDGSFFPGSYEGEANEAIEQTVEKVCVEAENLISSNKYSAAKAMIGNIPENVLAVDNNLQERVQIVKGKLETAVGSAKEKLIENISRNNGKLDEQGKQLLDEALLVSPDDYWLKFIKSKEQ